MSVHLAKSSQAGSFVRLLVVFGRTAEERVSALDHLIQTDKDYWAVWRGA
jgi:hypothetical protein